MVMIVTAGDIGVEETLYGTVDYISKTSTADL
jgi:hypothetical protein